MRRTTICRSSAVFAAVALLAARGVEAQNPPPIQRPINSARNVQQQANQNLQNAERAGQDSVMPARGITVRSGLGLAQGQQPVQGQTPASHTVNQGETLWSLAQQYLGDPMLWPEIYRLNTDVVEDPHWIFPGEELRLAPAPTQVAEVTVTQGQGQPQNVTVTPEGDTARAPVEVAPAAAINSPTVFSQRSASRISVPAIDANVESAYRAVREGEYFGAGFLTENQPLVAGRVLANAETSMRGALRGRTSSSIYQSVVVAPPPGVSLDSGQLLLSYHLGDEVPGYGRVVIPTGLLRVYASGERTLAEVVRQFDRVQDGDGLLPVSPFRFESTRRPEPVEASLTGEVIRLRDRREVPILQDVLFLDKGASDGVRLGDVFAITADFPDGNGGRLVQDQARAMVVNVRDRTASAIIIALYRGDVRGGSNARLVRRVP